MAEVSVPVSVDHETYVLLAHAATALRMTQPELLKAAIRGYLDIRRSDIAVDLRRTMQMIDGTDAGRVTALTGISPHQLDELGGIREP